MRVARTCAVAFFVRRSDSSLVIRCFLCVFNLRLRFLASRQRVATRHCARAGASMTSPLLQLLARDLLLVCCFCTLPTLVLALARHSNGTRSACDLFVAVDGSDVSNGTSELTAFRTIQRALDAKVEAQATSPTICLRGGDVFYLSSTVNVSARFSNFSQGLTLRTNPLDLAAGRPRAVLSGGQVLGPFQAPATPGDPWTISIPAGLSRPHVLFAEAGGWLQRARMPKRDPSDSYSRFMGEASTFKYTGPLEQPVNSSTWPDIDRFGFRFDNATFPESLAIARDDDVQVLTFQAWTAFWSDVAAFNRTNSSLMFAECV